jgi:hypothetical protein
MGFRVIQGSPCNEWLAPYIELLRKKSGATINSIYRGQDAASILHRHGKHTQAEIHAMLPAISNPPGRSTHELRSDGVAYAGPVGRQLAWWQQGIDVNDEDVTRMKLEASRLGWHLIQPYSRGVEFHHLNFSRRPWPQNVWNRANLIRIRATLPRS